jgi:hypothetical protein
MVVNPQPPRQPQRQRRKRNTARQRQQVVENRHPGGNQETDNRHDGHAPKPRPPMHRGIRLQMPRLPQHADKDILRAHMHKQRTTDTQPHEPNSIRDLLHHGAGAAQRGGRNPLAAVPVHDEREGEVSGGDDAHAHGHGFRVLLRPAHLGHDGEEGGGAGAGAEDCACGGDARGEGRVADYVVAEVVGPGLGGGGWAV